MPPAASPPARRSWWARNWLWFVPTGCLAVIVLMTAFVAMIGIGVFGMLKSTDAYKMAVERAKNDPRVTAALGTPIKESWFVGGSTQVSAGSGRSDLTIPISGPKGSGTIYAYATKSAGEWHYSKLVVKIKDSGETIDLREKADESETE